MRTWAKRTLAIAAFELGFGLALGAQTVPRPPSSAKPAPQSARVKQADASDRSSAPSDQTQADLTPHDLTQRDLTQDDRLSLIAAALDARVRDSESDCSHLVHAIYDSAGFPYAYAPSSDLYAGVEGFQRVKQPEPGDLIVWRGHTGIVIKPSQHIFFSFMTSGPGIDDYQARYWRQRGRPRFYRYVKGSCADCDSPRSRRLLKIKR